MICDIYLFIYLYDTEEKVHFRSYNVEVLVELEQGILFLNSSIQVYQYTGILYIPGIPVYQYSSLIECQ